MLKLLLVSIVSITATTIVLYCIAHTIEAHDVAEVLLYTATAGLYALCMGDMFNAIAEDTW